MKKLTLTLLAAAVAGLLATANAAQPASDQNNNNNAQPAAGDQPPGPPNAEAAGAPPGMAGDTNAAPTDQPMPAGATLTTANGDMAPADNGAAPADASAMPADNSGDSTGSGVITAARSKHGHQDISSDFVPPSEVGTNADQLRLNFRNAPLEMVLNYLSDAAGFIIVLDTRVNGNVSVISAHPMTRNEAVDLLNSVLNKNGYAAIRDGRTLTIVDKNDAKTRNIPVISGNDPAQIPNNAEIVTQIIPVRFVDARQLVSDLTSFVSPQATVVANDAGNSIVITDTQENIKHLTEIIRAIDDSAEAETEIKVFPLKYASPVDVATELGNVFPSSTSGSGSQSPIRFGGGGFGGGGGFARFFGGGGGGGFGGGGAGGAGGSSSQDRIRKETQVTAVADSRIQAVIVTAPKDLMDEIAQMMAQLDVPSERDQDVYTIQLKNNDPQAVATILQSMFQTSNSRGGSSGSSSSSQTSALQTRINNNNSASSSTSSSSSGFGTTGGGRAGGGTQF